MVAIHRQHWRDASIERSLAITDAWEVTKVYAGRLAEWVLFLCMVANIIEILPGVEVWSWIANTILGIQAVTLDIAGFGLATMAEQARLSGEEKAASRAKSTAYLLIGLMMVTVLSLSIGTLWHSMKGYTDIADKLLILIRVVMTVVYGHVLHGLRQHSRPVVATSVIEQRLEQLAQRLTDVSQKSSEGLHGLQVAMEKTGQHIAQLPPPEPVNYVTLAAQIVPLLPLPVAPDLTPVREQIALLTQHKASPADDMEGSTEPATKITVLRTQKQHSGATAKESEKASRAKRYIRRNPEIGATELAQKAQISTSYARRLVAEHREHSA